MSKCSANFQLKRSKVKVTERKTPQEIATSAIVRPNLLSVLDTLGNWADGRISCRHSAPTFFCFLTAAVSSADNYSAYSKTMNAVKSTKN